MKQCPKCKAKISDTAKICPKCGYNMGGDLNTESGAADIFNDDWLGEIENSTNKAVAQKQAADLQRQAEQAFAAYEYEKHTDGTYTITGLKDKTALQYNVPQGVISISAHAFEGSQAIKVTLPDGILEIGDGAFKACKNLSAINLPESLMIVGEEAFAECELLDIAMTSTVRKVGKDALRNTEQDKKRQAEEAKRKEEEEARRKAEAEAKRKAEEEARRKAEAEAKRKAEEEEQRRRVAELKYRMDAEMQRKAEAEAKRKAKEEARLKAAEEAMSRLENVQRQIGTFGMYKQWGKGKEPIEWLVLAVEDDKALLVSKYALDCKKYNKKVEFITWDKCLLRKWLNGKFLKSSFNRTERAKILSTRVVNPRAVDGKGGGNTTSDKIFLLSGSEVETYFAPYKTTGCKPTEYAQANGAFVDENNGNCNWWIRFYQGTRDIAAYVHAHEGIYGTGYEILKDVCVRPALWIKLES